MAQIHRSEAVTPHEGTQKATELFTRTFGDEPTGVWSAPGRVNIIGEHVDYNGGSCLPMALPHRAYLALKPREDRLIRLISPQTDDRIDEVNLDEIGPQGLPKTARHWASYIAGVAWALEEAGYGPLNGFDAALFSCVPRGGGLSSSAALECATAVALDEVNGLGLAGTIDAPNDEGRKILVAACQRAENEIAGAKTGGLDQTASLRCQKGHALALDCRDMSTRQIPFDLAADGLEMLIIDTRAAHSLADGQYASRRADCEKAAEILGVSQLVDVEDLDAALAQLDDEQLCKRTRHVVSEIARTHAFVELLDEGPLEGKRLDVAALLLDDSHDSLRDDYEVTCPELDLAVDVARASGSHGARMTGGGFGGSAIALVDAGAGEKVAEAIVAAYKEAGFEEPHFIFALPSKPAGREA
ncbi:galactokinase [Schaalia vaccimaxillae]|uniref:galactokinase n=1 Tax=Schaalia vaccimaxillae TaxID=183916 RepID=UPI0003B3F09A|nr:galactokinase [Schaalia vaccimaxillae]